MANDQNVELQITAKNLTQEAFNQVVESLKSIGEAASQLGEGGTASFGEMFAAMTGGVITGEALSEAFSKTVEVVGELGDKILELGERGGQIQGVEEAFQQFSGGAAQAAANLEALRAGTQGTVDDFVLMKDANKDLSSGIKLSAADFQTLGQGAVILAKQMGTDTASAFDTLNNALATGRTRALQLMGVHVDLDAATQHYAATLGTTSDNLTMAQKRAATAAAVMDQLRQRVQAAGDVQLTFGQRLEQVETYFVNLEDEVAKGIASSPVLEAGFNGIAAALKAAFGGDQRTLVKDIVDLVNDAAIAIVKMAEGGVTAIQFLGDSWYGLKELVAGVESGIATALLKLLPTIDKVSGALQYMGGPEGAAFGMIHQSVGQLQTDLTNLAQTSGAAFINAAADSVGFDTKLQSLHDNLGKTVTAMEAAAAAGPKVADGMNKAGGAIDGGQTALGPKVQSLLNSIAQLEKAFDVFASANGLEAAAKKYGTQFDSMVEKAAGLGIAFDKLPAKFQDDVGKINEGLEQIAIDKLDAKIRTGVDDILKDFPKIADSYSKLFAAADQQAEKTKELDLQGTALKLAQYDAQEKAAIDAINKEEGANTIARQADVDATTAYYQQLKDLATGKSTDIAAIEKAEGITTQAQLDENLRVAKADYEAIAASGTASATEIQQAHQKLLAAEKADADQTAFAWESAFDTIAGAALSAFASGGSVSKALESGLGGLGKDLSDKFLGWNGLAGNLYASSPAIASALGDLAGPLGGAAVTLGLDLGKKLWNSLFGDAGRQAVEQFAATEGGFDALHQQLDQLGASGEQLWVQLTQGTGNNNAAQAQANIQKVTDALNKLHTSENTQVSDLTSKISALGGTIDPALDPYIQKLQQAGILTQQNADALTALEGTGGPSYATLTALQSKYNLTAAQMGPSFQTQQVDANFQTLIDDIKTLTDGGGNLQAAMFAVGTDGATSLSGLGTAIQGDIQQAEQAGVAIPANLKDAAKALFDQGDLIDANGKKVTDFNSLTFGQTMQDSLDTLNKTLTDLIHTLTGTGADGLVGAMANANSLSASPTIKINTDWSSFTDGPNAATGGITAHAAGAYIREDHVAQVHAGEIVGPMDFMTRALSGAIAATGGAGVTAGSLQVSPVNLDGQRVADLIVRLIPNSVQRFGVHQ